MKARQPQINIVIDDLAREVFSRLGGGNISLGARMAAFILVANGLDKRPFPKEDELKQ